MELGAKELMTIGTVLCGLAATWGMVKGQIGRLMDDLGSVKKELEGVQSRLDSTEASEADCDTLMTSHNGSHKYVPPPKYESG